MSKQKMQQAMGHIKAREFDEARAILATVDHPKAREWEGKIDQLDPQPKKARKKQAGHKAGGGWRHVILLALLVVVLGAVAAFLLIGGDDEAEAPVADAETAQPNGDSQPNEDGQSDAGQDSANADEGDEQPTITPEPTSPSELITPPKPTAPASSPGSGDNRPVSVPEDFPFPGGDFEVVMESLDEDGDVFAMGYSSLSMAEIRAFYEQALEDAGYFVVDMSGSENMILSFLGNGDSGNVRVVIDEPDRIRMTIEMGPEEE